MPNLSNFRKPLHRSCYCNFTSREFFSFRGISKFEMAGFAITHTFRRDFIGFILRMNPGHFKTSNNKKVGKNITEAQDNLSESVRITKKERQTVLTNLATYLICLCHLFYLKAQARITIRLILYELMFLLH
jgi:hypothetical protein